MNTSSVTGWTQSHHNCRKKLVPNTNKFEDFHDLGVFLPLLTTPFGQKVAELQLDDSM